MRPIAHALVVASLVIPVFALAAEKHPSELIREDRSLLEPPRYEAAKDVKAKEAGVEAIFYETKPYRGKPTKTFAFMGVPEHDAGERVPAVVLIHGGGGTAFAEWVKLWNDRGYAAIAMDTCGAVPVRTANGKEWTRHEAGGPAGWDASFGQLDEPVTDQWQYHAMADVVLAHSLIRSLPGVDPGRVGVTGISWGGYLTSLVAGVDSRCKFAVPVYGCGFIDECVWLPTLEKMTAEKRARWLGQWDPRHYLGAATMPMLWVTGTNDFAYPFPALQKSYRLPKGERTLSITLRMPHGHPPGQTPEVIRAYADSFFKGGTPLLAITGRGLETASRTAWATVAGKARVAKAELLFTKDEGAWQKRKWETTPAVVGEGGKISARLPEGVKVYYLNVVDERGFVVSTEHEEVR